MLADIIDVIGISLFPLLTYSGRFKIYGSVNYAIIGSYNGSGPVRHQAIILSNAGIL